MTVLTSRIYWVDFQEDLSLVVNGCPVSVRRPGGTLVRIGSAATPAQLCAFLENHPEAIEIEDQPPEE